MPVTYRVFPEQQLVHVTMTGPLDVELLAAFVQQLSEDPAAPASFDELVDLREVTTIDVTSGQVQTLASAAHYREGSRRALVVTEGLAFGLARQYGLMSQTPGEPHAAMTVHTEIADALSALDLPDDWAPRCVRW